MPLIGRFLLFSYFILKVGYILLVSSPQVRPNAHKNLLGKDHWRAVDVIKH